MSHKITTQKDLLTYYSIADSRLPYEVFYELIIYASTHRVSLSVAAEKFYRQEILIDHNPYDYRNFETAGSYYEGVERRVPLQMMQAISRLQKKLAISFQESYRLLFDKGAIILLK